MAAFTVCLFGMVGFTVCLCGMSAFTVCLCGMIAFTVFVWDGSVHCVLVWMIAFTVCLCGVVVMSGSATVVHVNKLERQRQDSHRQYNVCHSNRHLAMRMLIPCIHKQ